MQRSNGWPLFPLSCRRCRCVHQQNVVDALPPVHQVDDLTHLGMPVVKLQEPNEASTISRSEQV
jgi:hypothetical protein